MFPEVVRSATLSRALTTQLLLGNAVEVLRLLQAGVAVDAADFDTLRSAAASIRSDEGSNTLLTSAAMSPSSLEMVTAARAALAPETTQALRNALEVLATALVVIADTQSLEDLSISVDEIAVQLGAIRQELAMRGTVSTDEARSKLIA